MKQVGTSSTNQTLFRWITLLSAIIIFLGGSVIWLLQKPALPNLPSGIILESARDGRNLVREAFPQVDFTALYPGMTDEEIDQVQRETFAVRYVYAPFVQFRGMPMRTRFVEVTPDGRRLPDHDQPWPPRAEDLTFFVFGGSTIFGNNLRPDQTVPVALERELRRRFPDTTVHVYNFGCGYYFSSQERALFNQLLESGITPDFAVFVDGLNDFLTPLGLPKFTRPFVQYTLPEVNLPPEPEYDTENARGLAVQQLLRRYQNNVRMISGTARNFGVKTVFVGQPVPFLDYPQNQTTYPFAIERKLDLLCRWGYPMFETMAKRNDFGADFLWLGDVFNDATESMYSDSVHYSPAGARLLARRIVERADQARLLEFNAHVSRGAAAEQPGKPPL